MVRHDLEIEKGNIYIYIYIYIYIIISVIYIIFKFLFTLIFVTCTQNFISFMHVIYESDNIDCLLSLLKLSCK